MTTPPIFVTPIVSIPILHQQANTSQIQLPIVIPPTTIMAYTKLKYSKFHGRKQDADDWMTEFLDTAQTNKEDAPAELLRLFRGLMKKDAMDWYHNDLTPAILADWDQLKAAFLSSFRKEKSMSRILARLRSVKMKDKESTRSYARRVRILLDKINPPPSAEMQAEYFMGGLPREMNKFVRQQEPTTIGEAIRYSQKFVDVEQSQDKELKKEERDEARRTRKRKKGKKRHSRRTSSSTEESTSDSTENASSEDTSDTTSVSSGSEKEGKGRRSNGKKKFSRKDKRQPDQIKTFKKTIDELAGKFDKLAVNLADNRPKRRPVPLQRPGVWCVRCGKRGHYPAECMEDLRYIDQDYEEDVQWTEDPPELEWRLVNATQPLNPPRPAPKQPWIGRGTGPMGTKPVPRPPMAPPGGYPDPKTLARGQCWNCGEKGHYLPSCPWPKAPTPIPTLCGNCGCVGHIPMECPNPTQPKLLVKYVKDPDPQDITEARLIYIEEGTLEEMQLCQEVEFVGGEVFRTSTRSMKQKDYKELRAEMTKKKAKTIQPPPSHPVQEAPLGGKQKEGLPKELDPAYDRNDPKYFMKDISQQAKDLIKEAQKEEEISSPQKATKSVKFEGVKVDEKMGYDILKDVSDTKANVTIGELLRENAAYRKQVRPLLTGRKRRYTLPSPLVHNVTTDDLGAPDIEVQVAGCLIRRVPVDGGSGVNIMIADTARALGSTHFEPTPKVLRMADQSKVLPIGQLSNISVIVGDKPFRLNFIIMEPSSPSSYPMLLGRPWLYQAKVNTSWAHKTFSFGNPKTIVTWETIVHQGETSSPDSGYTSEDSSSTIDSKWLELGDDLHLIEVCTPDSNEEAFDISTMFTSDLQTFETSLCDHDAAAATKLFSEELPLDYKGEALEGGSGNTEDIMIGSKQLK